MCLQGAFSKSRAGGLGGSGGSRQDTIEEELEAPRPAPAPASTPVPAPAPAPVLVLPAAVSPHEAALAELRRDVRNEVQRLQHKVAFIFIFFVVSNRFGPEFHDPG